MQDTKSSLKSFADDAVQLSKTPLGIIALFLVLIYALACSLIGFGAKNIKEIQDSPLIWFLTLFPLAVLIAFTYLVAKHHWKLYPASEYHPGAIDDLFITGPRAPDGLPRNKTGLAVSDPNPQITIDTDTAATLDTKYDAMIAQGYFILHAVETIRRPTVPGSGLFRVRVWIEGDPDVRLRAVSSVTYRLWPDFPEKQITTRDPKSHFDLWLNAYGEFPLIARVHLASGQSFFLDRYLDLPGRPTDS